jgi:hypothetical protein
MKKYFVYAFFDPIKDNQFTLLFCGLIKLVSLIFKHVLGKFHIRKIYEHIHFIHYIVDND